jgi:hypothetical protein
MTRVTVEKIHLSTKKNKLKERTRQTLCGVGKKICLVFGRKRLQVTDFSTAIFHGFSQTLFTYTHTHQEEKSSVRQDVCLFFFVSNLN